MENRFRFLREIVEAIIKVIPANRLAVRLSPNGNYNDMGSPEFRELFRYAAGELNRYELAYLHVIDGLASGFHQLGEPMTLEEFHNVFSGVIMGNCGYTQEKAEQAIREGHADLIAFGRPFISNPDLVERFAHGWPLAKEAELATWYSFEPQGYVDWPKYNG